MYMHIRSSSHGVANPVELSNTDITYAEEIIRKPPALIYNGKCIYVHFL